jgi:uncharacterized protein (UPF0333 family)
VFELKKAQGTIEYLILLSVVLIIAIMMLVIANDFFDSTTTTHASQTRMWWSGQTMAITNSTANSSGTLFLVVENQSGDSITMVSAVVDGATTASTQALKNEEDFVLTASSVTACSDKQQKYSIKLNYLSRYSLEQTIGPREIIVDCNS